MSDRPAAAPGGFHLCRGPLPTRPDRPRRRVGSSTVVDVHCHYLVAAVEQLVSEMTATAARPQPQPVSEAAAATARYNADLIRTVYRPALTNVDTRLADMDAMGVDVQAISPSPTQYHYWALPDEAQAIVAGINEQIALVCSGHPDRLVGLGTVALQHPSLAREQLRHAVKELGLKGVEISTLVNGESVDHPRFTPFWQEADELGVMVLLHPLGTTIGPRMDEHYLSNIVGQPAETTIALSRLIMSGHFDRYQRMRLCAVHGGGYLPGYVGRTDHGWRVRPECGGCAHPPSSYLHRIWFDTLVYDSRELRALIDVVSADRVVVGTDYPFDMGDYDPVGLIEALPGISASDKAAILGINAQVLLGTASARSDGGTP